MQPLADTFLLLLLSSFIYPSVKQKKTPFYAPSNIPIWVLHNKCSQDCFPSPNKGANQTSSPEKARESMANDKNPPNSELEHP
jgi:hypothetical protein